MSAPPQYSPDGRWWWDGQQWVPAGPAPGPLSRPAETPSGELLYRLRLRRHMGLLIAWFQSTSVQVGTYEQLCAAYREAQIFCLLAGWWSVFSLLALNWVALLQNRSAMRQLRQLAGRSD